MNRTGRPVLGVVPDPAPLAGGWSTDAWLRGDDPAGGASPEAIRAFVEGKAAEEEALLASLGVTDMVGEVLEVALVLDEFVAAGGDLALRALRDRLRAAVA